MPTTLEMSNFGWLLHRRCKVGEGLLPNLRRCCGQEATEIGIRQTSKWSALACIDDAPRMSQVEPQLFINNFVLLFPWSCDAVGRLAKTKRSSTTFVSISILHVRSLQLGQRRIPVRRATTHGLCLKHLGPCKTTKQKNMIHSMRTLLLPLVVNKRRRQARKEKADHTNTPTSLQR